jgi:hypothetical protein
MFKVEVARSQRGGFSAGFGGVAIVATIGLGRSPEEAARATVDLRAPKLTVA